MSSNKKIRNRLNKLFTDIQQTEHEDFTVEDAKTKRAVESDIPVRVEQPAAMAAQMASSTAYAEGGSVTNSVMAIPFQATSEWNLLQLESDTAHEWQEEEQSLVRQVVDQLGLALQNAKLFQQTERQNRDLAILNEMGRELGTQLEINQIIQTIYLYTSQLMDTMNFFVALYDEEAEEIGFPLLTIDGKRMAYPSRKMGQGLTDYVLRNRKVLLLNGELASQIKALGIELITLGNAKPAVSWLGVPLNAGEKTLGAIVTQSVATPYLFAERERDLLTAIASQAAIAIQNAQLFHQTQQQNAELATLNELANKLSGALKIDGITRFLYEYTGRLMDVTDFYIALYNPDQKQMTFPLAYFDNAQVNLDPIPIGNGLSAWVFKNKQPLYLPEEVVEHSKELGLEVINIADDAPAQCWLGVPMALGQEVMGLISVQSTLTPRLYTERHRDLLLAIASQAAIAIQNARLFEETQKRAAELAGLNEIIRAASAEIDLGKVLEATFDKLHGLLPMDSFILALYDAQEDVLDYKLMVDEGVRYELGRTKLDQTAISNTVRSKQPKFSLRTPQEVQEMQEHGNIAGNQNKVSASLIYVPLLKGNEVIGVISVQSYQYQAYKHSDVSLLENVANQLVVAIQNAQLFEQTQKSLKDLELINRLTSAVSSSLDIQASLQLIAEDLNHAFNVGHVGIALLDADRTHLILTADAPTPVSGRGDLGLRLPVEGNPATIQVLTTKKPVFVPDVVHNPLTQNIAAIMEQRGTKNLMIFPLLSGNEVIGSVGFDTYSLEKTFSDSEIRLVETVLFQVAASIRNAQLFAAAQARARREKILREITDRVRATTDPDTIIRTAVRELGQALNLTAFVRLGTKEELEQLPRQVITGTPEKPKERKKPSKGGK